MKLFIVLAVVLSLTYSHDLHARPGDLDSTFGVNGVQVYDFGTLGWSVSPTSINTDYFKKIKLNRDGKLLLSTNSYSSGY